MPTTVYKIVDGFPFPKIPPIVGTPKYNTIAEVNLKLNSNSASVQSNLGCGTLGLLQLTVSHAIYNTLSVTAFVVPVNPRLCTQHPKQLHRLPNHQTLLCF